MSPASSRISASSAVIDRHGQRLLVEVDRLGGSSRGCGPVAGSLEGEPRLGGKGVASGPLRREGAGGEEVAGERADELGSPRVSNQRAAARWRVWRYLPRERVVGGRRTSACTNAYCPRSGSGVVRDAPEQLATGQRVQPRLDLCDAADR